MKIGNNEIGFFFNVRARINIGQMTSTKRFADIGELFQGNDEDNMQNVYKIARILNNEYELKKAKESGKVVDAKENYAVITMDDILTMDCADYIALQDEIVDTIKGNKEVRTVESEPKEEKGKKPKAKSSN